MSNYTKKRIKQFSQNKRIYTVYSGYNHNKYFLRNFEKEKFSIIFVGNLKKRKGLKVLCNAIVKLPLDIKENIKLRLIGQFNSEEFIQFSKLFKEHKIKYKVYSNISDEELSILFNKSTVNVLPSITENYYYEGFGIVHSEAIASNCISIGSLDSGNESAIKDKMVTLLNKAMEQQKIFQKSYIKYLLLLVELPKGRKPLKWSDVTAKFFQRYSEKLINELYKLKIEFINIFSYPNLKYHKSEKFNYDLYWDIRNNAKIKKPNVFHEDRAMLLYEFMREENIPLNSELLDIGSGDGRQLEAIKKISKLSITASDISEKSLSMLSEKYKTIPIDLNKDFITNKFNLITAFEVLEHLDKPEESLLYLLSRQKFVLFLRTKYRLYFSSIKITFGSFPYSETFSWRTFKILDLF